MSCSPRQELSLRASGYFDLDGDGLGERWITLRHRPLEKLRLYILTQSKSKVRLIPLGTLDNNLPEFSYLDEEQVPPVVLVDRGARRPGACCGMQILPIQPSYRSSWRRFTPTGSMKLSRRSKPSFREGGDPFIARSALYALADYPGLTCEGSYTCDHYYYRWA